MSPRTYRTTIYREIEIDVDLVREDDGSWRVDFSSTDRKPIELTEEEEEEARRYAAEDSGPSGEPEDMPGANR